MDRSDSHAEKQILKILLFALSIFFILDCYAISRHFFNLYNIVFMLTIYPIMFVVALKFNDAIEHLINDNAKSEKTRKRFFFLLALFMAFIASTDNFLEYSMISLSSGIINYSMHYFLRFCVIYSIILIFSKSMKKNL
ncbi:hypothetical protein [Fusibacter ferrireducens]|uniref:Uncharacterized protein n=1 Tax=Fusibacter ferrireducens TaxID=2785058 RepID=A0ABR9ZV03_9FIRM|nr:hypothetical protein [Fusibacter ferrireducens]MBF4693993.1 hypothetical protein [Fusibacter ferrireducens]